MTTRGAYPGLCAPGVPKSVGARIRKIRAAWGWTQGRLAERLNTDQQIISSWERDKAQPTRASLALLAEFFGMTVEALATGEGFRLPDPPPSQDSPISPLSRALPVVKAGYIIAVPLGGGEPQDLTLPEARSLLGKVVKGGGRAWLVFDGPGE